MAFIVEELLNPADLKRTNPTKEAYEKFKTTFSA